VTPSNFPSLGRPSPRHLVSFLFSRRTPRPRPFPSKFSFWSVSVTQSSTRCPTNFSRLLDWLLFFPVSLVLGRGPCPPRRYWFGIFLAIVILAYRFFFVSSQLSLPCNPLPLAFFPAPPVHATLARFPLRLGKIVPPQQDLTYRPPPFSTQFPCLLIYGVCPLEKVSPYPQRQLTPPRFSVCLPSRLLPLVALSVSFVVLRNPPCE